MTKATFLVRNSYNANTDEVTIYNLDGRPVKVTRANARDLLRMGYTSKPNTKVEVAPADPKPDPVRVTIVAPAPEAPVFDANTPLIDIARALGAHTAVEYLNSMTLPALRDFMESHYNVKPHHKKSKDNLIQEALKLEEARIDSLPAWHPEVAEELAESVPAPAPEAPAEVPAEAPVEEPKE